MSLYFIITTVDSEEKGREIARKLVEERIAACVSVSRSSFTSFYHWKGKLEEAEEWILFIKAPDYDKVEKRLKELHPYSVPEIVGLRAEKVFEGYLNWAFEETEK